MKTKTYVQLSGIVFFLAGFVHLIRLLTGFPIIIAGITLPVLASAVILPVAWFLAYSAWKLGKK